jgi:hypothetical protein
VEYEAPATAKRTGTTLHQDEDFIARVEDFVLACHIAHPGSIWVEETEYFTNDQPFEAYSELRPEPVWSAIEPYSPDRSPSFSILRQVELGTVWKWYTGVPDVELFFSEGQLCRAINY